MKLYLIEQSERRDYDTFSSAVVAAMTSKDAQRIHPEESWAITTGMKYGKMQRQIVMARGLVSLIT